ncbi:MAG: SMC-Scp complex subunit ScpB [Candidatus Omnitrophica bacterium]|nr:SMC-Scp complex subunit ScpB [Candidatus Omnitrophota bacterium]
MQNADRTKNIIEALLIVSESGLSIEELKIAVTDVEAGDIKEGIRLLKEDYSSSERAFNIAEIAGKYRIVTKTEFLPWINNLYKKAADRLTGPSLETLAIVAYKQPATRAEVESVRGVNVGGTIKTLLDKDLICVKGRKDAIGRPLVYGTTNKFLEIFGLNSVNDLPALKDFSEEDLEYGKPQEQSLVEQVEENIEVVEVGSGSEEKKEQNDDSIQESGVSIQNEEGLPTTPNTELRTPDSNEEQKENEAQKT